MFKVTLTGFKTKEQAEAFVSWYSNSGEQDAGQNFEMIKENGGLDVSFMGTKGPSVWEDNTLIQSLEMSE